MGARTSASNQHQIEISLQMEWKYKLLGEKNSKKYEEKQNENIWKEMWNEIREQNG